MSDHVEEGAHFVNHLGCKNRIQVTEWTVGRCPGKSSTLFLHSQWKNSIHHPRMAWGNVRSVKSQNLQGKHAAVQTSSLGSTQCKGELPAHCAVSSCKVRQTQVCLGDLAKPRGSLFPDATVKISNRLHSHLVTLLDIQTISSLAGEIARRSYNDDDLSLDPQDLKECQVSGRGSQL